MGYYIVSNTDFGIGKQKKKNIIIAYLFILHKHSL